MSSGKAFEVYSGERNNFVEGLRHVKLHIKSHLMYCGITIPEEFDNPNWSKSFQTCIKSQEMPFETGTEKINFLMKRFEFMHQELLTISNQLRGYARKHYKRDYYLLMSVPGIGGIVAVSNRGKRTLQK